MANLKFYDGLGNESLLGQTDKVMLALGRKDFGMAEPSFFTSQVPRRHGAQYRGFVMKERVITIPLVLHADDSIDMEQLRDSITKSFNPLTGQGTLRYERDNGTVREIRAILEGGLTMATDPLSDAGLPLVITLNASDPLWYDPNLTFYNASLTTGSHLLSSPLTSPLYTTSQFQPSNFTITNQGTAPAWPDFSIQGPCQDPSVTNSTTGKTLGVTGVTIPAGCALHIGTKPGYRDVSLVSGSYAQNLVHNPNFQASTSGWTPFGQAVVNQTVGDGPFLGITGSGKQFTATSMGLTLPTSGDFNSGYVASAVATTGAQSYTLSFYAKPISGGNVLRASLGNNSWTNITISSGWNRYSINLTAGTNQQLSFTITLPGTIRLDGVMLTVTGVDQTYIDGGQPGCVWDGAPNYSTSSRWGLYFQNAMTSLSPGSQFWSLAVGSNNIQIVTIRANGNPGLSMAYHTLYAGV